MKVAYSKNIITPVDSMLLGGYDVNGRYSTGIHDDIYCRTMLLEDNNQLYCFTTFDLLCLNDNFINRIKELCNEYGIKNNNVFAAAIHTHSAPLGCGAIFGMETVFGRYDDKYVNHCLDLFNSTLKECFEELFETEVRVSFTRIKGICSERHDKSFFSDDRLWKIEFYNKEKKSIIFNYSCHPTVMHEDNTLISADFVGETERELEKVYDFSMFYNGSAGDVSTRFTRQKSGFEEVERIGKDLAEQILNNEEIVVYEGKELIRNVKKLELELETVDKDHLNSYEDFCNRESNVINRNNCKYARIINSNVNGKIKLNVSIIELVNGLKIVTIPSEIYSGLTKELTDSNKCMIFSYTNGYNLYIPNKAAYERFYYEAAVTLLKKGEAEKLVTFIKREISL